MRRERGPTPGPVVGPRRERWRRLGRQLWGLLGQTDLQLLGFLFASVPHVQPEVSASGGQAVTLYVAAQLLQRLWPFVARKHFFFTLSGGGGMLSAAEGVEL
jgi:hypothetical protein